MIPDGEIIVGELSSLCAGGLRYRDGDIFIVKIPDRISAEASVRSMIENELTRVGVEDPKVIVVSDCISFDVISRS